MGLIARLFRTVVLIVFDIAVHLGEMPRVRLRRRFEDEGLAAAISARKPARIAIVAASPLSFVRFSMDHLVEALEARGHLVVITQSSAALHAEMQGRYRDAILVRRRGQGRDFGAYKDLLLLLQRHALTDGLQKLVICNDSVFYSAGVGAAIAEMDAQDRAWSCLFENFEFHYHAQSFFLAFGPAALAHPAFWNFWQAYRPYSSRKHSIDAGEVGLSRAMLRALGAPHCVFNGPRIVAAVLERFSSEPREILGRLLAAGGRFGAFAGERLAKAFHVEREARARPMNPGAGETARLVTDVDIDATFLRIVATLAERHNPTHSVALLANHALGAPLKRDLAQRADYHMAAIARHLVGYGREEMAEIEADLREKGLAVSYRGLRRILFDQGRI